MSKEEAIKTLQELLRETNDHWYEETYSMAIEALKQMPSVDAQHWISCSEGLPEENGEYLVTDVSGGTAIVTETYFITDCDGEGHWGALDVIAWMSLPEPHKDGE